jgi:hypothetical protein
MSDVIPVRLGRRAKRRHALPQDGGDRTLCGRSAAMSVIDDAFPDCRRCLARIAALGAEVVAG